MPTSLAATPPLSTTFNFAEDPEDDGLGVASDRSAREVASAAQMDTEDNAPTIPLSSSQHLSRPNQRRGSDEEYASDFDFDIISDTTSLSGLTSPVNPSSPFSMSPFASPRMGDTQRSPPHSYSHSSPSPQRSSSNGGGLHGVRPISPAVSTTSTMSDLDIVEHDDAPREQVNYSSRSGTIRRFTGRGSNF
ncbi:hypothetical protein NMY22_g4886 [Coprinellus aureogranulatus]|nr:hypothetical protein NMY22_g4886 [Coprinellus aureogranulatus]